MPILRHLDQVDRVWRTTISGPVTFGDVREHFSTVRKAGTGTHRYPELIDARSATGTAVSRKDLLSLAHHARETFGDREHARRAVVVGSPDDFSMARTLASLVAGWVRVGVFSDPHAAEEWLRPVES